MSDFGRPPMRRQATQGCATHESVEYPTLTDTYRETCFDHYGARRWQLLSNLKYLNRAQWKE
jgi:hypothetical protein